MPYDSKDLPLQEEVKELVTYAEGRRLELLLAQLVTQTLITWGSTNINPRRESLHDFFMSTGLIILNRETELTFMDCRRQKVIDITICSRRLIDLVGNWRVFGELSGSDHRYILLLNM